MGTGSSGHPGTHFPRYPSKVEGLDNQDRELKQAGAEVWGNRTQPPNLVLSPGTNVRDAFLKETLAETRPAGFPLLIRDSASHNPVREASCHCPWHRKGQGKMGRGGLR